MVIERVPSDEIEKIVGHKRLDNFHVGRADHDTHTFYILHSEQCRQNNSDLRICDFSIAMSHGINPNVTDSGQPEILSIDKDDGTLRRYVP